MIYILAPRPPKPSHPVIINIGGSVGNQGANEPEDVMYVKFLLKTFALCSPAWNQRTNCLNLLVDGASNPAFRQAIIDYQTLRGEKHTPPFGVAGRVSPASTSATNWDSDQTFLGLTYAAKNVCGQNWPMIGTMQACVPALTAAVRRALTGN